MTARLDSEYLYFVEIPSPARRKTAVFDVRSRRSGSVLGQIKWYGSWRQYTFWPSPNTVWNRGCLQDINRYIQVQMDARRQT